MRTDFNRKKLAVRKKRQPIGRFVAVSLLVIGGLVGGGAYLYVHKDSLQQKLALSGYFARVKAYFHERKRIQHDEDQVLAANRLEPIPKPVHFEFYTTLPDMHVSPDSKPDHEEISPQKKMQPATAVEEVIAKEVPPVPVSRSTNAPLFDENELQKQITHEMTHTAAASYVLQLGVFRSQESAEKFSQQLATSGLPTVIKALPENNRYRVQIGPFANKVKVKTMQQKLQKQGIASILLVLNE
jgi:cell division protein FtsN